MVSAPASRELVRHRVSRGLSERRSLRVIGRSASALRYNPACDHNCALKEKIIALAQRHRRYGASMIHRSSSPHGGNQGVNGKKMVGNNK